jgi:tetratricopeptide (TPR) repeat protein
MRRVHWIAAVAFGLLLLVAASPLATSLAASPHERQVHAPQPPAQAPQAKPPADAGQGVDQPADFKAFNEASRTAEPQKRIDALQKFVTDFPDSQLKSTATSEIRSQYLRSLGDATKKYFVEADKYVQSTTSFAMMNHYLIASEMLRAGVLFEQAEDYALKGLAAEDEAGYIKGVRERAKAAASKPKAATGGVMFSGIGGQVTATLMPPRTDAAPSAPTDDDLRAQFRSQRAQLQNTLGQIYLKRGKNAEAEKTFREVYANPDLPSSAKTIAVRELANFARKAGDDKALVQYLLDSVVAGARPEVHTELRDAYKKTHGGSIEGLEATLDAMYAKSLPKIDAAPFARPKTKEPRLVVAELFTGAECPPCVGIDLAFEAALERYKPRDLALLVYHQHIPGPDPMTNPSTEKRLKFYNVRGVPTNYIDGKTDGAGGGGADQAVRYFTRSISPAIEKALAVQPEARLNLKASVTASGIRVSAAVDKVTSKSNKLRLHIVLAEERLRYHGGNGIRYHPMVVRAMAGTDGAGFAVPAGKGARAEWVFDLPKILAENRKFIDEFLSKPFRGGTEKPTFSSRMDDIDPTHLVVVAFVQDEDAAQGTGETIVNGKPTQREVPLRHILQAASVKVPAPGKRTTN